VDRFALTIYPYSLGMLLLLDIIHRHTVPHEAVHIQGSPSVMALAKL
jgi:hypothetical protein